jgi:hypothetical protein
VLADSILIPTLVFAKYNQGSTPIPLYNTDLGVNAQIITQHEKYISCTHSGKLVVTGVERI